jgi:Rnl2 family RNA ligase
LVNALIISHKQIRYDKISSTGSKAAKSDKKHPWCATEKVHGANFSIYVWSSGQIKCAKRTGFIEDGESFFGHFEVIERYRNGILALSNLLFEQYRSATVVLFGELFGGAYPDCQTTPPRAPVQTGVWYCPHLEFMLFDICINESPHSESMVYLPFSTTIDLGNRFGLFCSEPLFIGPLNEALAYPSRFPSTIPARLDCPPLSSTANIAEGIVVRMYDMKHACGSNRGTTKVKVSDFSENDAPPPTSSSSDLHHLTQWIKSMVNPNRIESAVSKIGRPGEGSNAQKIVDEVLRDLREECGIVEAGGTRSQEEGASDEEEDPTMKEAFASTVNQISFDVHNYLRKCDR